MNASAFLITTGRGSLAEGRKGGGSLFARTFTIEGRCERLGDFARVGYEKVLPALRRLDGFEGLLALANHQNSKVPVVTLWKSEEAMRGGEEASHWLRAFGAEIAGGEVTNVERYNILYSETKNDVVLAEVQGQRSFNRR
jgi:heme-degrading monooxygenase HmoA